MRLLKRKCTFLLDILGLTLLFIVSCLVVYQFLRKDRLPPNSFISADDLRINLRSYYEHSVEEGARITARSVSIEGAQVTGSADASQPCTMQACFDASRCKSFRVYVYPNVEREVNTVELFEYCNISAGSSLHPSPKPVNIIERSMGSNNSSQYLTSSENRISWSTTSLASKT